jgi:hypothetical protein
MSSSRSKSAPSLTRAAVQLAFQALLSEVTAWENDQSKELEVDYQGGQTKGFSASLEQAVEQFLDATADAGLEVDIDAKPIVIQIDGLAEAYTKFKQALAQQRTGFSPGGSNEFWSSFNRVKEATSIKIENRPPMPIKSLLNQGVSYEQIASIYGWTENGIPNVHMVAEEVEKPGTHYDPDTWVNPAIRSRIAMIEQDWRHRTTSRSKQFDSVEEPTSGYSWRKPTLEEMVRADAPAEQIARCFNINVYEAEERIRIERDRVVLERQKLEEKAAAANNFSLQEV